MMHRLREALGIDQHVSTFGKFRYYRAVAERLAELIEPSIPADPGEAGLASVDAFIRDHIEKPIDRDALLELADEMENDTCYLSDFDHRVVTSFARRIREILNQKRR